MGDRVVVVGGGVVGCAVARALAPDTDVVLLERGRIASGATARAAGEVTTLSSYADRPSVGWHAVAFFRAYDGTGDVEFTERPAVELVTPEFGRGMDEVADTLADRGLPVRYFGREAASERYPTLDLSNHAGVLEYGASGFLDPHTFATTLAADAEAAGATVRTDTPVRDVVAEDGRVVGVETDDGRVDADRVVAAVGWRTRAFLLDHVELPVRPYRTQCVVLEPDEPLPEEFPMGSYAEEHVYFRPERNGNLLVGGFSVAEDDPERASRDADEAFRDHVAELVPTVLDGFDGARFVDGWAGVDGATPDTRPVVDAPEAAPDGLVVATGFHGRGVMTAPVAATAVRALVRETSTPFPLAPFALARFEDRSAEFTFDSISARN